MRSYKYSRSFQQAADTASRNVELIRHLESLVKASDDVIAEIKRGTDGTPLTMSRAENDLEIARDAAQAFLKGAYRR